MSPWLLYTLLDAADEAGIIGATAHGERWRETNARLRAGGMVESEAGAMRVVLVDLEERGALEGTWIQRRWQNAKWRAEPGVNDPGYS